MAFISFAIRIQRERENVVVVVRQTLFFETTKEEKMGGKNKRFRPTMYSLSQDI